VATLEVVVFAFVVDGTDLIGIKVRIVRTVCDGGIITPGSFPEFVENPKVLISLQIPLVVLDRRVDTDSFEGCFLPTRDDVPAIREEEWKSATF
jgi:hypothetical protein